MAARIHAKPTFGDSTKGMKKSVWPDSRRTALRATVTGVDPPYGAPDGYPSIGGRVLDVPGIDSENSIDIIIDRVAMAWDIPKQIIIMRADGVRKMVNRNTLLKELPPQQKYYCSLRPPKAESKRTKNKKGEKWHQGGALQGSQFVTKQFAEGLRYVALRTPPESVEDRRRAEKARLKRLRRGEELKLHGAAAAAGMYASSESSEESVHVAGQKHAGSWGPQDCADAAAEGDLEGLQNARGDGATWDLKATAAAAQGGHLDVLEFLRANGCPWNEDTVAAAARGGQLDMIQYCREGGCPWDGRGVRCRRGGRSHPRVGVGAGESCRAVGKYLCEGGRRGTSGGTQVVACAKMSVGRANADDGRTGGAHGGLGMGRHTTLPADMI